MITTDTLNAHVTAIGNPVFLDAVHEAWDFGPIPETGPESMDTGEEILLLLARLACLVPMQQARLQLMEIPERDRTEQRKWLENLDVTARWMGIKHGFLQHQLRKLGYSRKATHIG